MKTAKHRIVMPMKVGNHKIGGDTIIMNMGSAHDCVSRKMGLCQLDDVEQCYAYRDEYFRKRPLHYRRQQEAAWNSLQGHDIAYQVRMKDYRRRKSGIRYIRMSEGGDFRGQQDIDKLNQIAFWMQDSIIVYVYTARKDLDYSRRCSNLIVNGSGWMCDNEYRVVHDDEIPEGATVCPGSCLGCDLCKVATGTIIYSPLRRRIRKKVM